MKKETFKVTPWEVKGDVDYTQLVKEFGVSRLSDKLLKRIEKHAGELHLMLRRGVFFAHRDLDWLLDEYEKGNKFFLYTGCGPSGGIHLGHVGTWLFTKWLQEKFDCELWFQFTDDEKFLFKDKSYEEIQKWTYENMLDVAALGFKPGKTHFIVDTRHAGLLYPIAVKFAKKITFSTVKASFGMTNEDNIGKIFYTSMQAAPAVVPSVLKGKNVPCLIPLGIDQDTHFRVARDVYPKLGFYKPAIMHSVFWPALKGPEGKMGASDENSAIFTTDSAKEVERKIKKYAFSGGRDTVEEHRRIGGNVDVDVAFQYLRFGFMEDDVKLEGIRRAYENGDMLTSELKSIAIKEINEFLKEHQLKRAKAKKDVEKFLWKG
ncbi:MAG: tryptophan--tRNA ligase [Nanoarchaeota archaeon]|nr:tryptophan--tRNA ligase [Nanoarchaeota archaeon]MBU1052037.1 tryptophan--tRNA ligase [Nanoarchaeota archaeon]MBU1987876.1 tryptophan--tRNA ligase [Nanoarchaeota archaeon]